MRHYCNIKMSEFIDTTNQCIKNEIDIKEEYLIETEQVLLPVLDACHQTTKLAKCGDIFISTSDLILACVFCDDRFGDMWEFGEHIRGKHLQLCGQQSYSYIDSEEICCARDDPDEITENKEEAFTNCTDDSRSSLADDSGNNSNSDVWGIGLNNKTQFIDDQDLFCATCNRHYKNKKTFRQHQVRHHKPKAESNTRDETTSATRPDLYCEICNRHYKTKYNFRSHAARHETVPLALQIQLDPNYLTCKYCNKQFADRAECDEHLRTHDLNRPFSCPHCSKSFSRRTARNQHMITHTGERPFKCDRCPRAFTHATTLKGHIRTHLGIKRFSCELCGKKFLLKKEEEVHMRTHTGEKPFQCEDCGRGFVSCGKLTEHRKRHTGIKNFKCDICGNLFYSNIALKDHKVKHSDARPYRCPECGDSFPRRKTLKAHVKIHSDIKEYVCNICGKGFAQAAGLYSHKKSHGEKLNSNKTTDN